MGQASPRARRSMDRRTRSACDCASISLAAFLEGEWTEALARNGARAAQDAKRLGLTPLTIEVAGERWTLSVDGDTLGAYSADAVEARVRIDQSAFDDLVTNHKTAMGLLVHQRVEGDGPSRALFNRWDPVLRSVLDSWHVYAPGEIAVNAPDGSPLDLSQSFTLADDLEALAHFFSEAGFLLLKSVISHS